MKKVILITGASAGFGKLAVKELLEQGHTVYAVARRLEHMRDIEKLGAKIYKMDVTLDEDVDATVLDMIKNEGKIDVLVNNAGYGSYGMVEAVSIEAAKQQFNANVFGLARVTKAVLPYMRKNRSGTIINMSSVVGRVTFPMIGWYGASKHAVEGLSDALRAEVKSFGIKVSLIEPGAMNTEFLEVSLKKIQDVEHPREYEENVSHFIEGFKKQYAGAPGPEKVVKTILKATNSKNPRARYTVGKDCKLAMFARAVFPTKIFDNIRRMMFNIK